MFDMVWQAGKSFDYFFDCGYVLCVWPDGTNSSTDVLEVVLAGEFDGFNIYYAKPKSNYFATPYKDISVVSIAIASASWR